MKTLSIGFILMFITFCSHSQLQVEKPLSKTVVGKVTQVGNFIAELYYLVSEEKDTTYSLMYRNQEYSTILDLQHITFSSDGNAADALYKILKSVFLEENKKNKDYKVQFKLGENHVSVSTYRTMGITGAFVSAPVGYFMLTERQVDKLFGKIK